MAVIFDEVSAEVTQPRPVLEETAPAREQPVEQTLKRDVLQTIERRQRRELRLQAD